MNRFFSILILIIVSLSQLMHAQTTDSIVPPVTNNIEISLLTCGVGEELYASFGHTGIRVKYKDSGKDEVYNYGTFNFGDPDFYSKFTMGKLNYWVEKSSFNNFKYTYEQEGRSITAQILQLTDAQAAQMVNFLENNIKPENKYYKYDFIFDNCATRVRDVIQDAYGPSFEWGGVLRGKKATYRQVINQYLYNNHWSRFGINILLGARIDSVMTDQSSMFIPNFLYLGAKNATLDGKDFVQSEDVLLEQAVGNTENRFNGPFWINMVILLATLFVYFVPGLQGLKNGLNFIILFITGLLGILMLFMWLVTDHQACDYNWNILWALPSHAVIAFIKHKSKSWYKIYGLAGISCLIALLIIHTIGLQLIPLMELIPLFGSLLFIYMDMYRQAITVLVAQEKAKDNITN